MLGEMIINVVEPGSVIKDGAGGEAVVDEGHAVRKGREIYVTQAQFEALRAHPMVKAV